MKIPLEMVYNNKYSGGIIDTDMIGKLAVEYEKEFPRLMRLWLRRADKNGKLNFVDEEWSLKEE